MFDIHSHIIYAIDDGSRNPGESLRLIRKDVDQGATAIFATPHYSVQEPSDPDTILRRLEKLKTAAREQLGEYTPTLFPGNEVLYFDSMTERLRSGEILTMAGSSYVLIEFYTNESYQTVLRAVRNLRGAGYRPIIAHAERFEAVQNHGLEELIKSGAYIQVSTEPLNRDFFGQLTDPETRFIRKALKDRQVHFLGTDMHRLNHRPPVLEGALAWMRQHLPGKYCDKIFYENAEAILRDEPI